MAKLTPNEAITSHKNCLAAHRHSPTTVDDRRRAPKHFARVHLLRIVQIRALRLQLVQKCPKLQSAKDGQEVNLVSTQKRSCNLSPKPQSLHVTRWSIKVVTTVHRLQFLSFVKLNLLIKPSTNSERYASSKHQENCNWIASLFPSSLSLSAKAQMQWTPAELAPNESSSALESKNQRSLLGFVRRCHRSLVATCENSW